MSDANDQSSSSSKTPSPSAVSGRPYPTVLVLRSALHVRIARPLFMVIAVGVLLAGIAFAAMGIALVHFGSTGATKIHFFGQSFDSSSVGVAAIFLGATTVVVVLVRLMKRTRELAALPPD